MASLPPKILPRLGQLIRMLASNRDYEALAAVRALGKTLTGQGLSLHDLAEAVETEKSVFIREVHVYDVWEPPEPVHGGPPSWNDLRDFERRDWLTLFYSKLDISDRAEMAALTQFRSEYLSPFGLARPTRKQLELFTRLMARAWRLGLRP